MTLYPQARTAHHNRWTMPAVVLLFIAVILATAAFASTRAPADGSGRPAVMVRENHQDPHGSGVPAEADGLVPGGAAAFDLDTPAVGNLEPDLHNALRMAVSDAADTGIGIFVTSGWRSRSYQEYLLRDAVDVYGSQTEAARWVATPDTSTHVSGDAVDVGPATAIEWLTEYGAAYGLCQVYANEPWHYELRSDAPSHGCPPRYADATQRMQ